MILNKSYLNFGLMILNMIYDIKHKSYLKFGYFYPKKKVKIYLSKNKL